MITRPLDLASRLRREPRNFDALFFVNGGLIVLFFSLSGSQFVLAPGLGVNFELPRIKGAREGGAMTTHHIKVESSGLIITGDGRSDIRGLREWLVKERAKVTRQPTLLVKADIGVATGTLTEIFTAANEAGFKVQWAAEALNEPNGGR